MRWIRVLKPFFHGTGWRRVEDPPFEVDETRAIDLVKAGLAEFVVLLPLPLPEIRQAISPAPAAAAKAVAPRQKKASA